jgi:putative heme-binding domain-containing protein
MLTESADVARLEVALPQKWESFVKLGLFKCAWIIAAIACIFSVFDSALVPAAQKSPAVAIARKKLETGGLTPAVAGRFIALICEKGDAEDLAFVFDKVVAAKDAAAETRALALNALLAAAETRKLRPEIDASALAALIRPDAPTENVALQITATRLAGVWKVAAAGEKLRSLATAKDTPKALREAAVHGLVAMADESAAATFETLASKERAFGERTLGVGAMAAVDMKRAASLAPGVLASLGQDDDAGEMLLAFLDRRDGAESLATAIAATPPPTDAAKRALEFVYSVGQGDSPLARALSDAAGLGEDPKPPTPEEFKQLVADVAAKGDPHRGEAIFRRADLNCMKCHALNKAGGEIGPDLAAVGSISPVDFILTSILDPDQAIKEVYQTRIFATIDGELLQGIVLKRSGGVVEIKEASGAIRKLPEADIDMEKEGKSLMPKGLVKFMTRQDLVDLARFLSELGKPGEYALPTTASIGRWRVLKHSSEALQSTVPDAASFERELKSAADEAWIAAYSRASGELPLEESVRRTRQSVLYLYGELDVTAAGSIELVPHTIQGIDVWIDGQRAEVEKTIDIEAAPGRRRILFRVDTAKSGPTLKVEVRKSAGSAAEFTCVGGP